MSNQLIIRWVRHAESCANLLDKKLTDKPKDEDEDKHNTFIDQLVKEEDETYKIEPFRRYILDANSKLTSAIAKSVPENEAMVNHCRTVNENDCWKSTVDIHKHDEFSKAAKAIYTREKMIKSSWLFTPTLSYVGTQQAIQLGREEKFKSIVGETNIIITSATVRTIMTALLSLNHSHFIDKKIITIVVVPFINEHENVAGEFDLDNANRGIPPDKILAIVEHINKWLDINTNIFIDVEFYRNMCKKYHRLNPCVSNIQHFRTYILPKLNQRTSDISKPMYILAFTHGYVIRKLLTKSTDIPPNVSIYEENNELPVIQIMGGIYIRRDSNSTETDYQDQDDKMKNICSLNLHSLRGDINKLLNGEQTLTYKKSKTKIKRKYNKRRSNKRTRI
jgi:hypothetical protein